MSAMCTADILVRRARTRMSAVRTHQSNVEITLVRRRFQLLHDLVDREARRGLAWREVLERRKKLRNEGLRGDEHKHPLGPPALIPHRIDFIRMLERVGTQIEQLRKPQEGEGIRPDVKPMRPLFREHDLVFLVAQIE